MRKDNELCITCAPRGHCQLLQKQMSLQAVELHQTNEAQCPNIDEVLERARRLHNIVELYEPDPQMAKVIEEACIVRTGHPKTLTSNEFKRWKKDLDVLLRKNDILPDKPTLKYVASQARNIVFNNTQLFPAFSKPENPRDTRFDDLMADPDAGIPLKLPPRDLPLEAKIDEGVVRGLTESVTNGRISSFIDDAMAARRKISRRIELNEEEQMAWDEKVKGWRKNIDYSTVVVGLSVLDNIIKISRERAIKSSRTKQVDP